MVALPREEFRQHRFLSSHGLPNVPKSLLLSLFIQCKTSDTNGIPTGEVRYVHLDDLALVSTNEADPQFMRYVESNGSTNGSSLTRSRGTVAEENLYTTVSPTAGHPNNMGQSCCW